MTGIKHMIFIVRNFLLTVTAQLKTGRRFCSMEKIVNEGVRGRELEDYKDLLPSKKLCTNESKGFTEVGSKIKKRNVAMLLSYNGYNYLGMQINPCSSTIEGHLLAALYKANLISEEDSECPYKIHLQRAARTDKGVSAVRQVVSLKIVECAWNVENINSNLPEDIRVMCIKRVTKGFNSKNDCSARTYSYTLPTFAFAPEIHDVYPENYRIDEETLQKVNDILKDFLGTRNYHNFTPKKNDQDPSARRYIMSFKTESPFVDGAEFITLTIKGQSFMLHQIRKMVGFTIAVLKGVLNDNIKSEIWMNKKLNIPMAPGLGLVLEEVHYDKYNRKFGTDGIHEPLTWDEVGDEIDKFKKSHILSDIIKKENTYRFMFDWIRECIPRFKNENNEVLDIDIAGSNNLDITNENKNL